MRFGFWREGEKGVLEGFLGFLEGKNDFWSFFMIDFGLGLEIRR